MSTKRRRKPSMPRIYTNEQHVAELTQHLTKRGPGDEYGAPTPERARMAREAGERIIPQIMLTDGGNATGVYNWHITPVVNELRRRGTITSEEYAAADKFMGQWYRGMYRGPATVRYEARTDGGCGELDIEELRWQYAKRAKAAFKAVDPIFQPALAWLIRSLGDPVPLKVLGAYYAPDKGEQTQSSQGAIVLRLALVFLCRHYQIDHSFSQQRVERLSEILLERMAAS